MAKRFWTNSKDVSKVFIKSPRARRVIVEICVALPWLFLNYSRSKFGAVELSCQDPQLIFPYDFEV